jgi:hypothetical protein
MSLIFFEGFDNCSSFKDVSGIFKIASSMLDDPRTINPVLSSGSVESISAKNSGNMIVLESSYRVPSNTSIAAANLTLAQRVLSDVNITPIPINLVGSGTSSSPFTFGVGGPYSDVRYYGTLPSFVINGNGNFNFTAAVLVGRLNEQEDYVLNFQIFRTRNSIKETMSTNQDSVTFPVKGGDIITFTPPSPSFAGLITPRFWAVETTAVFFPSIGIDLGKNLTQGVVGFSYAPILPPSGNFGNGIDNFTPIACLTDDQYRPHFFICNTSTGQLQLRKFNSSNFSNDLQSFYNYRINGSANTDGVQQTYPRFLKSTTDPTLTIGGNGTNLTLIAESAVEKNTLVNNFWNYIELKFNMETQDLALRINRKNTSTRNDLEFNGNNIISSTNPLTVLSGVFSGSGTYLTPYTGAISNSGIFKVHQEGSIFLNFTATWNSQGTPSRSASFFKNGSLVEAISLPNQGLATFSSVDYQRAMPVVSGDVFGFTYNSLTPTIKAYFIPSSSLSDQLDRSVRYLVLGTMWGQDINGTSPASHLGWKTLLDDIYVVDTSGSILPNDFLGSVSCRRIPFNQQVRNTTSSGNLASVSDVLSGASGFATPSGNGTLFFDAINQEFNVKSSGFSVNNNNIIGLQINMNGFSLNTEDYIGVGLEIENGSGSYDFSPVVLSRNSTTGGYARGQLYTTNPSGLPWTEEAIRNTTFKLKSLSE